MYKDPRIEKLANTLLDHSIKLKKGERVMLDVSNTPEEMTVALIRGIYKRGGYVHVSQHTSQVSRALLMQRTKNELELECKLGLERMKNMDCYIGIGGSFNIAESSDVPSDQMKQAMKIMRPLQDYRVNKTRWVILRWPTPSFAQQAQRSTEAFQEFFFDVCTMDYAKMEKPMKILKKIMESTDKVHIKGPETDLQFSIKKIPSVICCGGHNIPDGEVFTSPVKTSVNGVITHNAPTIYQGTPFDNIRLEFKDGKIVKATSNNTKKLNAILDSDEGARYIGEFAIATNPRILHPMRDILFDEKIGGSFHFTPGQAYEDADNGNRSSVHWDMVSIQRKDYGGGEIWFDGKLFRKDGIFTDKRLAALNPKKK